MSDHAVRVATIVREEFGVKSCDVLALAFLHDVLERGDVTVSDLERHFGAGLADRVVALTKPLLGPKSLRRELYFHVICCSDDGVKLVKLADCLDDLRRRRDSEAEAKAFLSRLGARRQSAAVASAMRRLRAALAKREALRRASDAESRA